MSILKNTKRKWLRARISLRETMYNILKINRERKKLPYSKNPEKKEARLNDELRILNKLADKQAKLVRLYELKIQDQTAVAS